jgi:hypothetical protein
MHPPGPLPQRYLSLGFDGSNPHKCTSSSLKGAVKSLWHQNGLAKVASTGFARSHLRYWAIEAGGPYGLWGVLPDGRWLSLDPEEAQDALQSDEKTQAYEATIAEPPEQAGSLIYQIRFTRPDGTEVIEDHPTVRAALTSFVDASGIWLPLGSDFTWMLLRVDLEYKDIALCARLPGSAAGVPVLLKRAESALASNHAELKLAADLRNEFIQNSDWALPNSK